VTDAVLTDVGLEARTVDPVTDPTWRRLVEAQRTDIFHSPAWCGVLADTYGFELSARVLIGSHGDPLAGVVYAEVADVSGTRRLTLPFSDFCDPVADTEARWRSLADHVAPPDRPYQIRCLRNDLPVHDPRFTVTGRARWHAVDIDPDLDQQWSRIDPGARRSIRKARNGGVEVRAADDVDDLRAFYELHLRVRKHKYRLLAQPFRFFELLWERLIDRGDGVLLLARHDGRVVGGVLYLQWGDTLYYKFNASDADHLSVRPNDLLAWSGIEHAHGSGLRRLDFGLTDWDQEGLLRYKRKYATSESVIHTVRTGHTEPGPPLQAWRADLGRLTEVLVDPQVPDGVTERAGAVLYRYFA
jgi:CelD/BcsL family acetyltransferase involved in cellulose biosynthesis